MLTRIPQHPCKCSPWNRDTGFHTFDNSGGHICSYIDLWWVLYNPPNYIKINQFKTAMGQFGFIGSHFSVNIIIFIWLFNPIIIFFTFYHKNLKKWVFCPYHSWKNSILVILFITEYALIKHDFQIFPFISILRYALKPTLEKKHYQIKYGNKIFG